MMAFEGTGGVAVYILTLSTGQSSFVSFVLWSLCFWGKRSWCPVYGRITGHRADHSVLEEGKIAYPCQQLNCDYLVI
jgi:hypothetical protein